MWSIRVVAARHHRTGAHCRGRPTGSADRPSRCHWTRIERPAIDKPPCRDIPTHLAPDGALRTGQATPIGRPATALLHGDFPTSGQPAGCVRDPLRADRPGDRHPAGPHNARGSGRPGAASACHDRSRRSGRLLTHLERLPGLSARQAHHDVHLDAGMPQVSRTSPTCRRQHCTLSACRVRAAAARTIPRGPTAHPSRFRDDDAGARHARPDHRGFAKRPDATAGWRPVICQRSHILALRAGRLKV